MAVVLGTQPGVVSGHPFWHFAVVAAAGVLVFLGIKVREWQVGHAWHMPRPAPAVLFLALASADSAAIHGAVCPEHFRESTWYGIFFLLAAAAQASWAVAIVLRPSRTLLTWAAAGNAAVVILWALTRTTGLPIGPEPWRPEAIGNADVLATVLEVVVSLGALWVRSGASAAVRSHRRPSTA